MITPEILAAFGLPENCIREAMTPGTVSSVWKLRAEGEMFLLRTLPDAAQGATEWQIYQHLRGRGMRETVPELLPTRDGAPYLEAGDTCWQLQRFVNGARPEFTAEGSAARLAETVLRLESALADCPPVARPDRFDLGRIWAQGRENWETLETGISRSDAEREAAECLAFPQRQTQVIHGDLGPWNMLDADGRLRIIDFGEARMGEAYFDLASAFAGLLNHAPKAQRDTLAAEFLAAAGAELPRLREQLSLWIWRGFAWAAAAGQTGMLPRLHNVRSWMEQNLR